MKITFDGAIRYCERSALGKAYYRVRLFCDGMPVWMSPHYYGQLIALAKAALRRNEQTVPIADVGMKHPGGRYLQQQVATAARFFHEPFAKSVGCLDFSKTWLWKVDLCDIRVDEVNKGVVLPDVLPQMRDKTWKPPVVKPVSQEERAYSIADLQHTTPERLGRRINEILAGQKEFACTLRRNAE